MANSVQDIIREVLNVPFELRQHAINFLAQFSQAYIKLIGEGYASAARARLKSSEDVTAAGENQPAKNFRKVPFIGKDLEVHRDTKISSYDSDEEELTPRPKQHF